MSYQTHLPFLRRYSRSITRNQTAGDSLVMSVISHIVSNNLSFATAQETKINLFKLLNQQIAAGSYSVPTLARQTYILSTIENFEPAEVRQILDLDLNSYNDLMGAALVEITSQNKCRVLIIEDEPVIANDLKSIVEDLGHTVVGIAETSDRAVDITIKEKPELILADVCLADDSSGIDAVEKIQKIVDAPVIYITGFPEKLLTGLKSEPVFIVTKPYDPDILQIGIAQAFCFD